MMCRAVCVLLVIFILASCVTLVVLAEPRRQANIDAAGGRVTYSFTDVEAGLGRFLCCPFLLIGFIWGFGLMLCGAGKIDRARRR